MARQKDQNSKYMDVPTLSEVFADDCVSVMGSRDGIYIIFGTLRLDPTNIRSGQPRMNRVVSCRLVLTVKAMIELYKQLDGLMGKLEQDGVVSRSGVGPNLIH